MSGGKNYAERYLDSLPWRIPHGQVLTAMGEPVDFDDAEVGRRVVAEHNACNGIPDKDLEAFRLGGWLVRSRMRGTHRPQGRSAARTR